jgi:hypothetical protein
MITLKVLKTIKDSSIKGYRKVGDLFDVSLQRVEEMKTSLGNKFESYFLVIKGTKEKKIKGK